MKNIFLKQIIRLSSLFLVSFTPAIVSAQCDPNAFSAQNRWWSSNASALYLINFSTGQAVLQNATASSGFNLGFEGSAVAVNPVTNQLLFYTDGNRVFRASDNAQSPTLVGANSSATEAAAIIPMPGGVLGDDFIVFGNSTNVTPANLITASYKLSTNTISNVTIRVTGVGEALEVVPQLNGTDYWILLNVAGQTRVYTYTAAGGFVNTIVSSVPLGVASSNRGSISWIPQLPNKVLIGNYANTSSTGTVGVADFDRATGTISNYVEERTGQVGYAPAISPNGRYIYYTDGNEGWLGTGRIYDRVDRVIVKSASTLNLGGCKLAPDGKIYWARYNQSALITFSNPDDPVNGDFGTFSIAPASSGFNLPNNTYWACEQVCSFSPVPVLQTISASSTCPATTVNLTAVNATNLPAGFEVTWHAATPANGSNKLANPSAVTTGTYYAAYFNTGGNCYGNSGATATFTVTTTTCAIGGQVFRDAGLPDGLINTSGGNAVSVTSGAGYISLVNAVNVVNKTTTIAADGNYSFTGVAPGNYTAVIHNVPAGSTSAILNAGWVSTSEGNINTNAAGDGTPDGKTMVAFVAANMQGINFGIQRRPTTTARDVTASDILLNQPIVLNTQPLQGSDPEDGAYGSLGLSANNRFRIKGLPANAQLAYNNLPVAVGQLITSYEADKLTVTFSDPGLLGQSPAATFNYTVVDDAGFESAAPVNYIVRTGTPLPATGLALSARQSGKDHALTWKTNTEFNTQSFLIESSIDGIAFENIGQQPAAGISYREQFYNFTVGNMGATRYYRVLLQDKDGTSRYSNIAVVKQSTILEGIIVYPNPAPQQFTVYIPAAGSYQVSLFDMQGKMLQTNKIIVPEGGMAVPLSRGSLPPGVYQMTIQDGSGNRVSAQKIIVN